MFLYPPFSSGDSWDYFPAASISSTFPSICGKSFPLPFPRPFFRFFGMVGVVSSSGCLNLAKSDFPPRLLRSSPGF